MMTNLLNQWHEMIARGTLPLFELNIIDDDYLIVELSVDEKGIYFTFDDLEKDTFFSGDIVKCGGKYLLPWCEYTEDLDKYLENINEEINEGFLLPNNLMVMGE